MDSVNIASE